LVIDYEEKKRKSKLNANFMRMSKSKPSKWLKFIFCL
jgi:hypothetical protein